MKAEYRGAVVAACEAVWLKRILKDLDNMSNIYLAHNLVFHARTKHIEVQYQFIR